MRQALINYPKLKLALGLKPIGKQFRCEVQRGQKRKWVELTAYAKPEFPGLGYLDCPKGWAFVSHSDGSGNIEEVETCEVTR